MAGKMYTVAQVADFMNNGWPSDDHYLEDSDILDELLTFDSHTELYSPSPKADTHVARKALEHIAIEHDKENTSFSFVLTMDKYLKTLTTTQLIIEVPKDEGVQAMLKDFLKQINGKVL